MKNTFFAFGAFIFSLLLVDTIHAQSAYNNAQEYYINPCDQTIFNVPGFNQEFADDTTGEVSPRAMKDFQRKFEMAPGVKWSKTVDGGYVAHFTDDAVRTIVAYDGKGQWHHTIFYYDEKKLPQDVRKNIKSTYYDYEILKIAEVHFEEKIVYMVYVQDETRLKTIRVLEGEMEEVQNYTGDK